MYMMRFDVLSIKNQGCNSALQTKNAVWICISYLLAFGLYLQNIWRYIRVPYYGTIINVHSNKSLILMY